MMSPSMQAYQQQLPHPTRTGEVITLAATAWGNPKDKLLFCLHGLTRNGRDFDQLASKLAEAGYYVICPDMPGRGKSPWLSQPEDYALPTYVGLMLHWLALLGNPSFSIVGTSMGGMIGMCLAAMPESSMMGSRCEKLVLNDVGMVLARDGLDRIAQYLGKNHSHTDKESAIRTLRQNLAPWGIASEEEWQHLLEHSIEPTPEGTWCLSYDPAIAVGFKQAMAGLAEGEHLSMQPVFAAVTCPIFVIRGETSDLLDAATLTAMQTTHPATQTLTIPATGHAPHLAGSRIIQKITDFLTN